LFAKAIMTLLKAAAAKEPPKVMPAVVDMSVGVATLRVGHQEVGVAAAEPEEEPEGEQALAEDADEDWLFQGSILVSTSAATAAVLQPPVPPPPAPCFPVFAAGWGVGDLTPCIVELAASTPSSSRTACKRSPSGSIADESEECQWLLPTCVFQGTCHPASSCSSPGPTSRSSYCDLDAGGPATPADASRVRTSPGLARFLSPMSSWAASASPARASASPCPTSTPVRVPVLTMPLSSGSWCPPLHASEADQETRSTAAAVTHASAASASRDFGAWFRAVWRTLSPLTGQPTLERLVEVAELCCSSEPAEHSSAGSFGCCCVPQLASKAVEAEAAASVPATEQRLLSVPRPSVRGLRATSLEAMPTQLTVRTSTKSFADAVLPAESQTTPKAAMSTGAREVVLSPGSLPALPRQAPALPLRAPSGDSAVDAAELLLARVVDPFGEDGR